MKTPHTVTPLYDISDLVREYTRGGSAIRAVDGVDLQVHPGELLAIEGTSGSGKSTLLAMLGGLDRPTSGSIRFDGIDLSSMNDRQLTDLRAREIGFIFQGFNLIPTLNARQNIEAVMAPLGLSSSAQRARALELLERVGLAARADHLPSLLSGGEQQRVAVARALANGPRVVLADEPTGNLDSTTATEVITLLRSLTDDLGVTIVLVTHDSGLASQAARRLTMRDGCVVGQLRRRVAAPAIGPGRVARENAAVISILRPAWLRTQGAAQLIARAAATIAVVGIGAAVAQSGASSPVAAFKEVTPQVSISDSTQDEPDLPNAHPTLLVAPAKAAKVIVVPQPTVPRSAVKQPQSDTGTSAAAIIKTASATAPKLVAVIKPQPVPIPKPIPVVTPPAPVEDTTMITTTNLPGWPYTSTATSASTTTTPWWWPRTTTQTRSR